MTMTTYICEEYSIELSKLKNTIQKLQIDCIVMKLNRTNPWHPSNTSIKHRPCLFGWKIVTRRAKKTSGSTDLYSFKISEAFYVRLDLFILVTTWVILFFPQLFRFLPPANKFMFLHLMLVILFTGGGGACRGGSLLLGVPALGGCAPGGMCLVPGGCLLQGGLERPPGTATAAGGTHPTGWIFGRLSYRQVNYHTDNNTSKFYFVTFLLKYLCEHLPTLLATVLQSSFSRCSRSVCFEMKKEIC